MPDYPLDPNRLEGRLLIDPVFQISATVVEPEAHRDPTQLRQLKQDVYDPAITPGFNFTLKKPGSNLKRDNPVEKEYRNQKSVKNWILSPVSCRALLFS